jgi:hypothetical protein
VVRAEDGRVDEVGVKGTDEGLGEGQEAKKRAEDRDAGACQEDDEAGEVSPKDSKMKRVRRVY